jgi:hypothetical protein
MENNGNSFDTALEITIWENGVATVVEEPVLAAFSFVDEGGAVSVPSMTAAAFSALSVAQARERYALHRRYVEGKYPGLDVAATVENEPIRANPEMCPNLLADGYRVSFHVTYPAGYGESDLFISITGPDIEPVNLEGATETILPNGTYQYVAGFVAGGEAVSSVVGTFTVQGANVVVDLAVFFSMTPDFQAALGSQSDPVAGDYFIELSWSVNTAPGALYRITRDIRPSGGSFSGLTVIAEGLTTNSYVDAVTLATGSTCRYFLTVYLGDAQAFPVSTQISI